MSKYNFVLSYDEEAKLSPEARSKYYVQLRDNFANSSSLKFYFSIFLQKIFHRPKKFILKRYGSKIFGFDLNVDGGKNLNGSNDAAKIYISSHQHFYDIINLINAIPERVIIMNSIDVPFLIKAILRINGVIFVDRKDKEGGPAAKNEGMQYLAKGYSVVILSEATLNGSPNKYLLSFHHGAFDMAQKMQVPIIPIVQEYCLDPDPKKLNMVSSCTLKFLPSVKVPVFSARSELYKLIRDVRDLMAGAKHTEYEKKYTGSSDVSTRDTSMQSLTHEYRKFVADQFATFHDMGVTYQDDELPAAHAKYNGSIIDKKSPPLNVVAWNPDTYELLDCGIKDIHFKGDLKKMTKRLLRGIINLSNVELYFYGSMIVIDISSPENINYDVIYNAICHAYPSDILKYYDIAITDNCSDLGIQIKALLVGISDVLDVKVYFSDSKKIIDVWTSETADLERLYDIITCSDFGVMEELHMDAVLCFNSTNVAMTTDEEILVIPDYTDTEVFSNEPFETDIAGLSVCSSAVVLDIIVSIRNTGVIDDEEAAKFRNLYENNRHLDIVELIDVGYAKGVITSRQRNNILSYVYCYYSNFRLGISWEPYYKWKDPNDSVGKVKRREKK